MKRTVAATLILLTACGGGDAKPAATTAPPATVSQTPSPTPTALATVELTAETKAVRAATAKTLAACPCSVDVWVTASKGDDFTRATMKGVYDPKTQTTALKEYEGGKDTGLLVRIVNGRVFMSAGDDTWVEISFAKMPGNDVRVFGTFALMDPRIALAAAETTDLATISNISGGITFNDVTFDTADAAAKVGPWSAMLKRMMTPGVSVYGGVQLKDGLVSRIHYDTPDLAGKPRFTVTLTILKTGVTAQRLTVPKTIRTIDAATYKGS